jgi:hypothetical protein
LRAKFDSIYVLENLEGSITGDDPDAKLKRAS